MNILPKKRWHVRTKENIARVRRDEAAAAEEEKKKQARIQKAETEARINFLRDKARSNYDGREAETSTTKPDKLEHINFFADLEEGKIDYNKANAEHEKEKKEEKEKYEKQIGYLTYLGQDTNEATGKKCWYEEPPRKLDSAQDVKGIEKEMKKKSLNDPIQDIQKYLKIMHSSINEEKSLKVKSESSHKKKHNKTSKHDESDDESSGSRKKHKSKSMHRERETSPKPEIKSSQVDLQQLRMKRLMREQKEKLRAEALLAGLRKDEKDQKRMPEIETEVTKPMFKQRYNSQFFPELARQNVEKTPRSHV